MAQIFYPSTNTISKASIFGAIFILAGMAQLFAVMGLLWLAILFSLTLNDYLTRSWFEVSRGWTDAPGLLPAGR